MQPKVINATVPFNELGWREVGRKLADAMCSSDLEVYYTLLCATVMRCEADKERIKPSDPPDDCDSQPILNPEYPSPIISGSVALVEPAPEKAADHLQKGPGF